jgi:hypothetical protein
LILPPIPPDEQLNRSFRITLKETEYRGRSCIHLLRFSTGAASEGSRWFKSLYTPYVPGARIPEHFAPKFRILRTIDRFNSIRKTVTNATLPFGYNDSSDFVGVSGSPLGTGLAIYSVCAVGLTPRHFPPKRQGRGASHRASRPSESDTLWNKRSLERSFGRPERPSEAGTACRSGVVREQNDDLRDRRSRRSNPAREFVPRPESPATAERRRSFQRSPPPGPGMMRTFSHSDLKRSTGFETETERPVN